MRMFFLMFVALLLNICAAQAAEPIVVLTYSDIRGNSSTQDEYGAHPMRMDPDAFQKHQVVEAETLGHIMAQYYAGSGLNMKFVELAILQFNPKAFVRGNPNFLYAGKTLHIPSVNQIKALITREKSTTRGFLQNGNQNEIFFFGG